MCDDNPLLQTKHIPKRIGIVGHSPPSNGTYQKPEYLIQKLSSKLKLGLGIPQKMKFSLIGFEYF